MSNMDVERIKKMTNILVACDKFEKERIMRRKKVKKSLVVFLAVFILVGGSVSVDALTDNKISDTIKDVLNVRVNGEDKNAKCEKLNNGNVKCTLDDGIIDNGGLIFEYNAEESVRPEVTYKQTDTEDEIYFTLKSVKD